MNQSTKKFTESILYVTFFSYRGCSIKVNLETPQTVLTKNKMLLKQMKADKAKQIEDADERLEECNYYQEMVAQKMERQKRAKEFINK